MNAGAATDFDAVVIGAGLSGAVCAALLATRSGLTPERVALVSEHYVRAPEAGSAPQLRVVAVSRAGERVLRAAGAWDRLEAQRLCAYERMRVWPDEASVESSLALRFDAAEIGEPNLGHIAENNAVQAACVDAFAAAGGRVLTASFQQLRVDPNCVELSFADQSVIRTRLLVAADGRQSPVRRALGIGVRERSYRQSAIVANIATERPHARTAWQRFLGTGPLALLPLANGECSLVWSIDEALTPALMQCTPDEFGQRLRIASDSALGWTRVTSERRSFPLTSLSAARYVTPRVALVGDAAHVIHPLAGQGANLGLLDAASVCDAVTQALAAREDPGALRMLRHYEQQRRSHNQVADALMTALQFGFAANHAPLPRIFGRGLGVVQRLGPLKQILARQALGTAGELPTLASDQRHDRSLA